MVKVRFKSRASMVFNENEIVYIEESRVPDVAGVVVVQPMDAMNNSKPQKKEA